MSDKKYELQNLIASFWDADKEEFSDYFIQMFVDITNRFNFSWFNEFNETKFTHSDINNAIEHISGSKQVLYRAADPDLSQAAQALGAFKKSYVFGHYSNQRYWVDDVYRSTGVVLDRRLILGWIAKQRPDRAASSFAPINDGNLYHATEKESFSKPNKRTESATAEL